MNNRENRVCLIEDDEVMGEALADRLILEGYDCTWFRAGAEAGTALKAQQFSVVICDIHLPDGNGEDLFTRLIKTGVTLPPFLFITGYGKIDAAVRLLKLGACDYLTKPVDMQRLLAVVDKALVG